jgi:hypothetical protein
VSITIDKSFILVSTGLVYRVTGAPLSVAR